MDTKFLQHLPQHSTRYSIKRLPEVHEAAVQLASFSFRPRLFFNQRTQNEYVVGRAEVFPGACLPLGFDSMLLSSRCTSLVSYHCKQFFFIFLCVGYRGIVHPPSDYGGTERCKHHCKQLSNHRIHCDPSIITHIRFVTSFVHRVVIVASCNEYLSLPK